jgi:antitoxin (DNA-binding transcriptional repressor) of toxin-antitoxin stability system
MKSVGVKVLKNNLSRYLDLVRQGEVLLVTDRDEVIAEIRMPSEPAITRSSPWVAFLEGQARRGALRLATRKKSRVSLPSQPLTDTNAQRLLEQARQDRR